jgi:hypothetical protein
MWRSTAGWFVNHELEESRRDFILRHSSGI